MKSLFVMTALAAGMTLASSAGATQLVANGDFSQLTNGVGEIANPPLNNHTPYTAATDWSTAGYNYVLTNAQTGDNNNGEYGYFGLWDSANGGVNSWDGTAPGGTNFVALDGDYHTASITQTITGLTVGKVYQVDYDYAFAQQSGFTGATIQSLSVSLGGSSYTTPTFDLPSQAFSGWFTGKTDFTATSSSEVLSFLAHGNVPLPPFALVSNVSMTAVPEPASWAMMIVGMGALGAVARRRRSFAVA